MVYDEGDVLLGIIYFFIIFIVIGFFVMVIDYIIESIAKMKILKKTNEKGWPGFIPIYSDCLICKKIGVNPWWYLVLFIAFALNEIPYIGPLICGVASLYFHILFCVSLSKAFGKSDSFIIGLILLKPIFLLILGFDSSTYIGMNPMNDFIFGNSYSDKKSNTDTTNSINKENVVDVEVLNEETTSNKKVCSNCGAALVENSMFCVNCGKKI